MYLSGDCRGEDCDSPPHNESCETERQGVSKRRPAAFLFCLRSHPIFRVAGRFARCCKALHLATEPRVVATGSITQLPFAVKLYDTKSILECLIRSLLSRFCTAWSSQ